MITIRRRIVQTATRIALAAGVASVARHLCPVHSPRKPSSAKPPILKTSIGAIGTRAERLRPRRWDTST